MKSGCLSTDLHLVRQISVQYSRVGIDDCRSCILAAYNSYSNSTVIVRFVGFLMHLIGASSDFEKRF